VARSQAALGAARVGTSSAGPGHLEQWVVSSDGSLVHRWWPDDGAWSSWWTMDLPSDGIVAVAGQARDLWDHYVAVADRGGTGWIRRNDDGWGAWERLDLDGVVDIALASAGRGHLELWAVRGDGALCHRWTAAGSWSEWFTPDLPDGVAVRSVAAGSRWTGDQHVVFAAADGSVWARDWREAGWTGWEPCGISRVRQICLASGGTGHLEYWAVQDSGVIVHRWWEAEGRWSDWYVMDDVPGGGSVAIAAGWSAGVRYQVHCLCADGTVHVREWHEGWGPWQLVWHD
jgi:hypothetical protein